MSAERSQGHSVHGSASRLRKVDAQVGDAKLTYAQVRDADSEGQIAFLQVVAKLIGHEAENDAVRAAVGPDPRVERGERSAVSPSPADG